MVLEEFGSCIYIDVMRRDDVAGLGGSEMGVVFDRP